MFNPFNYQPPPASNHGPYGSSASVAPSHDQQRLHYGQQQWGYPGYYHYNNAGYHYNSSMESSPSSSSASSSSSILDQYPNNQLSQQAGGGQNAWSDLNIKHERLEVPSSSSYANPGTVQAGQDQNESSQDLDLQAMTNMPGSDDFFRSPGIDFDPSSKNFTVDELRPQPIIRKRQKVKS